MLPQAISVFRLIKRLVGTPTAYILISRADFPGEGVTLSLAIVRWMVVKWIIL